MNKPADLLLISSNRRPYLERCLDSLLRDSSPFSLYVWDNASTDGSAELIASLKDRRVMEKRLENKNLGQREACLWFLGRARSDLVGKVDDDILLPGGWMERISSLLRDEPRFGMLGCWTFLESDWDEEKAAHKIVALSGVRVFRNAWIGGTAFLARREYLVRYLNPPGTGYGFPVDQIAMSRDGLVNGFPVPIMVAHHMSDPRSEYHRDQFDVPNENPMGLTARLKKISSAEKLAEWIAEDAGRILSEPVESQIKRYLLRRDRTIRGSWKRLLLKLKRG